MSIWCAVEGEITTSTESKLSIKKVFIPDPHCEVWGTVDTYRRHNGRYFHKVSINACKDGKWACDWLNEVIEEIMKQDPSAKVDLQLTSRWLT